MKFEKDKILNIKKFFLEKYNELENLIEKLVI